MPAPILDEQSILDGKEAETFVGGPTWSTSILVTGSGAEQRFKRWTQPRYRYQIDQPPQNVAMMAALEAFFIARDGNFQGFRFKDQADFQVTTPTDTVSLTSTTFQAVKRYVSGSVTRIRTIYKPIAGTVKVFNAANVEQTAGWVVDVTTGIITFATAPAYTPRWTGSFHVPVRLDTDAMQREMHAPQHLQLSGLQLIELRR